MVTGGPRIERLLLARLRGFCAGVVRAIDVVEQALRVCGRPVYVRKEIIHNRFVVEDLKSKGAVFIDALSEAPRGAWVIFSAHGVSPEVRAEARERGLRVLDATCPLVTKVHMEAIQHARSGRTILLIGHADHDEIIGTLGEAPGSIIVVENVEAARSVRVPDPERVAYLTQTTLSLDDAAAIVAALRERFPAIIGPRTDDICYATENRQNAVKAMAPLVDALLVLGAPNSSNSLRLCEVARERGVPAHLIERGRDVREEWLAGVRCLGLTAGASAPESLVQETVAHLKAAFGVGRIDELETVEERVHFALPAELLELTRDAGRPA